MGTNYELRYRPCDHCGRVDTIHVGKQSGGWSFLFHGYRHDEDSRSPFGFPVESRADWRRVFTERADRLVDEYGAAVADPVGWLDGLVKPDLKQRVWENAQYYDGIDRDPRDNEGFRFCFTDFS